MTLSVGQPAPEFQLPDQEGSPTSLTDLVGSKTLIVFIPFPFTGICDGEVCAIRDDLPSLADLDARVIVITCHSRPTNARWATEHGMEFPVLSDFWPHGDVARAYGVFDERVGVANRTTFVLDTEGIVREIIASDSLGTAREHDAYAAALSGL
jgi:peroxiredoxin (alkyl hydroperoxide reductase subunit C)